MADGEHTLPADEELFDQPAEPVTGSVGEPEMKQVEGQEPQNEQSIEQQNANQQSQEPIVTPEESNNVPEPVADNVEEEDTPRGIPFLDDPPRAAMPPIFRQEEQHDDRNFYERPAPARVRNEDLFHPAAYEPPTYMDEVQNSSEAYTDGVESQVNGEDLHRHDANEHTVWIDSDPEDNGTEQEILKQNFYLPYSDHNYDCADPLDRVVHPQEGPFPIIDGLDSDGNITKQYLPDEDPDAPQDGSVSPGTSGAVMVDQHQPQHFIPQQQQQVVYQQRLVAVQRPVGTTQPFSIGGNEYHQRQETVHRVSREAGNYRLIADNGAIGLRLPAQRVVPNSAVLRSVRPDLQPAHQNTYQMQNQPLGSLRTSGIPIQRRAIPSQQAAPGSYHHVASQLNQAGTFRRTNLRGMPQGIIGQRQAVRPMQATRPMEVHVHERDYEAPHSLQPAQSMVAPAPPPPPIQRRVADVAPHRMTQEEMMEQVQQNSQRPLACFDTPQQSGSPMGIATQIVPAGGARLPPSRLLGRLGPHQTGTGVLVRARAISGGGEDLLRSPQRALQHQQDGSPRKFQLKVADVHPAPTYSAPIPKASDQLPAQITEEDPPEEEPTSSAVPEKIEEENPNEPPAQLLEEETVPIKPTPPHRMGQEEKNAHLARLMADKEKPSGTSPMHPSSAPPHQHQPQQHLLKPSLEVPPSSAPMPLRPGHHQDDALAMVQSVFDPTKPRPPDTPKDKEAISKIADHLRFSAEKYETNKIPDVVRHRHDSAMSQGSQGHAYSHHDQMAMERDDGRRKRQSLTRYDMHQQQHPQQSSSSMRQQHQTPHHHQQNQQMEPPHRSRGRPKGSTGPQRGRFGNEPVAPHRSSGGARTLQPRQQAPAAAEDSDSESDRIEEEWTMRCHCEMTHPTGMSLECEKCKTWQHTLCMGLTQKSNTDGYMCELCVPRKLPISKAEAIRIQKKEIAKIKKEEKKEKRRSEPPEPPKKVVPTPSASSTRKSAPIPYVPEKLPQLNDYSKAALALLTALPQTQGAEQLLGEARSETRAKRMFVSEKVEALVTTEPISARAVLIEMNGYVSLLNEAKRTPGGGGSVFLYDGLMKGANGEDTRETQELIVVDTKKKGNDTRLTRRSCQPNCVLKHVLGAQVTLGVMLVATKEIPYNSEVTLPFDLDWIESPSVLECSEHVNNMKECAFEIQRLREQNRRDYQRRAEVEERRRRKEAERVSLEEKRRLEDEVRREREEQYRLLDEAEEKKRQEARAAAEAKRKQEREEAKKKKEAERAARQASEPKSEDARSETMSTSSSAKSNEPHKLSREERRLLAIEDRFRRQAEDEKRKEVMKVRAQEKALSKERKSMTKTPEPSSGQQPGTSEEAAGPSERARSQSVSHRRLSQLSKSASVEGPADGDMETPKRGSKRHESVKIERTVSPPAKRVRSSTVREDFVSSAKRASTSKTSTPVPKKPKTSGPSLKVKDLKVGLHTNAMKVISDRDEFALPTAVVKNDSISEWVRTRKDGPKSAHKEHKEKVPKREVKEEPEEVKEEPKESKKEKDRSEAKQEKHKEKKRKEEAAKASESSDQAGPAPPAAPLKEPTPAAEVKEEPAAAPEPVAQPEPQQQREATPAKSETSGSEIKSDKESREPSEAKEALSASRAGSEAKETGQKKGGTGPKKLSIEQYKQKRLVSKEEASTSGTAPAPPRQGFIPSTDASSTANATLSNIFLPGTIPNGPSTSDDAQRVQEEEPPAHSQSLADRAAFVFGLIPGLQPNSQRPPSSTSTASSSSQRPHDTRTKNRPSRWN